MLCSFDHRQQLLHLYHLFILFLNVFLLEHLLISFGLLCVNTNPTSVLCRLPSCGDAITELLLVCKETSVITHLDASYSQAVWLDDVRQWPPVTDEGTNDLTDYL